MTIKINKQEKIFIKNNKPFFYLADTVWSAFTNATLEEWEDYLSYRKKQGFNVLQINMLRQWDASGSNLILHPFKQMEDGTYDYGSMDIEYFDRAEVMLEMAVKHGFTPALVLLWCNYVPDTWADMFQADNKMPLENVEPYVEYVVQRYAKFSPIYLVSGDSNFPTERSIAYYEKALETVKRISPESVTTLHIQGRLREIPDVFTEGRDLDFYMYQSGHNSQFQPTAYEIAEYLYESSEGRPVVNGEPCYEEISYSRNIYGRFTRFDVRKAAWQSVLAGGASGITYGAHGIWSWHKKGQSFGIVEGEGFDTPYDWRDALKFEGAWDYSFLKYLMELYCLHGLKPLDIIKDKSKEIRAAGNEDTIVIYMPVNTKLKLELDSSDYAFTTIDLVNRRFSQTEVVASEEANTIIPLHDFTNDVLIIGTRNN
ncbi:DUF4038 domain-containing protein [Niallia taxi]|uniref:apiosidase-like domain-containing protein n=1 Tax=Niallia taxi TaxID=2499688 RepID=UPI003982A4C3